MQPDITPEIEFRTARSGGSGGQNVNKVETMVEGRWKVIESALVTELQKKLIFEKLANKITAEGYLLVKSQADRSQLGNKELVIKKMNELVSRSLIKKKSRIITKPPKAAKEKRIQGKKERSLIKNSRKRLNLGDI